MKEITVVAAPGADQGKLQRALEQVAPSADSQNFARELVTTQ